VSREVVAESLITLQRKIAELKKGPEYQTKGMNYDVSSPSDKKRELK